MQSFFFSPHGTLPSPWKGELEMKLDYFPMWRGTRNKEDKALKHLSFIFLLSENKYLFSLEVFVP